ncbi:unnamed protein product [Phytophthora fragariaefolia]|uniref:Unnamed protein product n=1 Tax=Phytophthora fragariaefolia TaxID=1490495 RepID=A0A9W6XR44_9STRA|nr:unnamed protein product [Phytophthora fragariaefolia]
MDKVVVTTQHVKNIETLDMAQNENVQNLYLQDNEAEAEEQSAGDAAVRDAEGVIERLKARLVACGNEQEFGVNHGVTFAAVIEMSSVKLILVLARKWRVPAKHGDVPNAYVKAKKEAELAIYIRIPQGMEVSDEIVRQLGATSVGELVLELEKALYGLKQAGRLWNELLHAKLVAIGFAQSLTDMCVYFRRQEGAMLVVGVYVDDLLVTGTRQEAVVEFFSELTELSF